MALFDSLKNRQKIKEETARAEQIKQAMYSDWNNLIQDHNILNGAQVNGGAPAGLQPMYSETQDGQLVNIGTLKRTPATAQTPQTFEFLFVYEQPDGQTTSSYYKLTSFGAFHEARGLGTLQLDYLVNINGKDIPCTATIQTSTNELLNINNVPINPIVKPAISSYSPQQCIPNTDEFQHMLITFGSRAGINHALHRETTADFMPGTGRDF